jgi:hypothetical protein
MSNKRGSKKRGSNRRRSVLGLTLVLLVCAAAGAGYVVTRGWPQSADAASSTSSAPVAGPTDEPADTSSSLPTADPEQVGGETADPSSGQTVATDEPVVVTADAVPVVVTYSGFNPTAGAVQLGGYAGVVEDGGTCTLTLTQGGAKVAATSRASADASTTTCGELSVPRAKLAPGTWQAVLSYASATHTGTAAPVPVEVGR